MAPFRSNVRFFDALTAFLIALCLHMVLGMLWERGARHAQRNWSCYYVLTPSSPIFKRVEYPAKPARNLAISEREIGAKPPEISANPSRNHTV